MLSNGLYFFVLFSQQDMHTKIFLLAALSLILERMVDRETEVKGRSPPCGMPIVEVSSDDISGILCSLPGHHCANSYLNLTMKYQITIFR